MKRFAIACIAFLSLAVAAYAVLAYTLLPFAAHVQPDVRAVFESHRLMLLVHIFAAAVALALGPVQFSRRFRERWPAAHRMAGRLYLGVGVGIGGLSGLYVALDGYGGPVANAGFASLALAWLFTGARAFTAIRRRDVAEHRRWMVRNWSLTLAAVTLRLYMPMGMILGIDYATAYAAIAWLCWVPNLAVAHFLVAAQYSHRHGTARSDRSGPSRNPRDLQRGHRNLYGRLLRDGGEPG